MPNKFDRCVKKVEKSLKKRNQKGNPYAICHASINPKAGTSAGYKAGLWGKKIRSKGRGRGLGIGKGKGPIGRHKKTIRRTHLRKTRRGKTIVRWHPMRCRKKTRRTKWSKPTKSQLPHGSNKPSKEMDNLLFQITKPKRGMTKRSTTHKGVDVEEFFEKRFKRKPSYDIRYFNEWVNRFRGGNPEAYMDSKSKKVFSQLKTKRERLRPLRITPERKIKEEMSLIEEQFEIAKELNDKKALRALRPIVKKIKHLKTQRNSAKDEPYLEKVSLDLIEKGRAKLDNIGILRIKKIPPSPGGEKKMMFGKEIITKPKPARIKFKFRPSKKLKEEFMI